MDAVHQTDADNDRSQTEELSTANVLAEDGDCQKDGQNRRHAAERAGDIRAHQPIGFKIQQRSGAWKQQSNAGKQNNGSPIAAARIDDERSKTPKEQRRGRDANCHAQPGLHPSQPELSEDEAGAEHEHRREGKNDRDGDGCCPASGFRSTMVAPTIADNAEVANSTFAKT